MTETHPGRPSSTTSHQKHMHSIPLRASDARRQNSLIGQLQHHKNRRLSRAHRRRQLASHIRGTSNDEIHHPASWRQSYSAAINGKESRKLNGYMTDVALSNCHLVLYSGDITLGSPPNLQRFRVDFDTAGSDLWVPSKLCDGTCASKHPNWNLYDPSKSTTYQRATEDVSGNEFALEYQDGEAIKGEHAKDTLRIGDDDIRIPKQVFAHVTHIQNFATCEEEEGILGLANAMTTSHGFPSLLGNILRHAEKGPALQVLPYNVFGMYLRSDVDDYEGVDVNNVNEKPRQSSELILGGVNQQHYVGCLDWHPLLSSGSGSSSSGEFDKYWSVGMDDVKVGGTSLNKSSNRESTGEKLIGVLDSGSSYIVGPQAPVAHMVQLNKAKCFRMNEGADDSTEPTEVDCNDPDGFDGAVLNNCDDPFFSVEFIIGGRTYILEKEDLMVHLDTLFGKVCIIRVVASQGMNGWILGDAFLNKYYTAFDFEQQKLGLALASESADDRCDRDMPMDVTNFWKNVYDDEDVFGPDDYQPDLPQNDNSGFGQQPVSPEVIGDEPATINTSDNSDSMNSNNGGSSLTADSLDDDFFTTTGDDEKRDSVADDDKMDLPSNTPPEDPLPSEVVTDIPNNDNGATQEEVDNFVTDVTDTSNQEQPSSSSSQNKDFDDDGSPKPVTDFTDGDELPQATDYTDDDELPKATQYTDDNNLQPNKNYDDDDNSEPIKGPIGGVESSDDDFGMVQQPSQIDSNENFNDDDMSGLQDSTDSQNFDEDDKTSSTTTGIDDDNRFYTDDMSTGAIVGSDDKVAGGNPNDNFYQGTVAEFDDQAALDDVFEDIPPIASPYHHEDPDRADVPVVNSNAAKRAGIGFVGLAGIVVVVATVIPVIAFLLHRKRKKTGPAKQQELFQSTYKKAEKKMLKQHRNLNYRNHQGRSPREMDAIDIALDELSYVDEAFQDEEGGGGGGQGGGQNGANPNSGEGTDAEPEFVLDSNILQHMN